MRTKLSLLAPSLLMFTLPLLAMAASCDSTTQFCNPLGDVTICDVFSAILNGFMVIGAPIAVVFVIIAGTKFVFAVGKEEALRKAKTNLMWTLVGIAIFFGAIVITNVIFKTVSSFLSSNNQTGITCTLK